MDKLEISKQDLLNYTPQQLFSLADYLGVSSKQSLDELLIELATTLLGRYQKGTMDPANPANLKQLAALLRISERKLVKLSKLDLRVAGLESLPADIDKLTSLKKLNLANNRLTTLPKEIGQLSSLQYLNLINNQLMTLPAEIGQLSSLQYLGLAVNQLTRIPVEIGQLSSLPYLGLDNNQFKTLPADIGQLSSLQYLGLANNKLTRIPAEIGQLSSLQKLFLNNNQLKTLPTEIGQLSSLQTLDLANNPKLQIHRSLVNKLQAQGVDVDLTGVTIIEAPERRIGDYTLRELQDARDRGDITAAEFQRLQMPFFFPEEEEEEEAEEEQLAAEAADCSNPTDDITKEVWTVAPPIKIKFLDPDPNKKPYILCLTKSTLTYYLKDMATKMAIWVQNPQANPMDTEGYGGQPYKNLPVQQIKGAINVYVLNPDILLFGGTFIGVPIAQNVKIGNMAGSFGIGQIHGQIPGYTLYYLMDETAPAPMDMNMIKTGWTEYINCIVANQTNCEISLIQKYPSMVTEKIKNGLLIKTAGAKPLDEQDEQIKIETIKILLDAGADINTQNKHNLTALHIAVKINNPKLVEFLLKMGAVQDINGETALIVAVSKSQARSFFHLLGEKFKNVKIVQLLIKAGADVNMPNIDGNTALMFASFDGSLEIINMLIDAGAKLDLVNVPNKVTALLIATDNQQIKSVALLIKAGADLNIPNNMGETALMLAAKKGYLKIARLLIKAAADLNIQNNMGETALMLATLQGYSKIVELLIKAGADLNIQNKMGETALDYAKARRDREIIALLQPKRKLNPYQQFLKDYFAEHKGEASRAVLMKRAGAAWREHTKK